MLTTRQWRLKDWLEKNHINGRYWSIEEIVDNVKYTSGEPCYKLNTNPHIHDKCAALGADVKAINWDCSEGQKIIIKDKFGGVKLAETEIEFNGWRLTQLEKLEKSYQYLNNLKWKARRDGTMPFINQALNPLDPNKDLKPIECYVGRKTFKKAFVFLKEKAIIIVNMYNYKLNDDNKSADCLLPNGDVYRIGDWNECVSVELTESPYYDDFTRNEVGENA